jgi:hypothetical protein
MSFLDNQLVTIDAVLTKKGRELMARNDGSFQITQFSLADDEVDYTLYNPTHPSGSAFYGEAIEKQPLLQAFTDETQMMKYKLVTLPRGTSKLPVLSLGGNGAITLKQGASTTITPETLNYLGTTKTNEPSGYIMTLADSRFGTIVGTGIDITGLNLANPVPNAAGTNLSVSQIGSVFTITATTLNQFFGVNALPGAAITTTITCIGRDSGARLTIPFTITKI